MLINDFSVYIYYTPCSKGLSSFFILEKNGKPLRRMLGDASEIIRIINIVKTISYLTTLSKLEAVELRPVKVSLHIHSFPTLTNSA